MFRDSIRRFVEKRNQAKNCTDLPISFVNSDNYFIDIILIIVFLEIKYCSYIVLSTSLIKFYIEWYYKTYIIRLYLFLLR